MPNTATATETTQARVRDAGWQPASWTTTATTGGNSGPGALRRLEITPHIPTSTAAPVSR